MWNFERLLLAAWRILKIFYMSFMTLVSPLAMNGPFW